MGEVIVRDGDIIIIPTSLEGKVTMPLEVVADGGIPLITGFRLPMKNLDKAWYEATTVFGPYNYHPDRCEDWNLETGGDTDWDEPLVAPFSGLVLAAYDWYGKVGGVMQLLGRQADGVMVVWGGWHLHQILVQPGQTVCVGDDIGTIGNAHGVYASHLHEQICIVNRWGIPSPTTFPSDGRYQWMRPSAFYQSRGVSSDLVERCRLKDGA